MVKIRLTRTGKKNAPSYRIIVADSRSRRDGKFMEILGHFNPSQKPVLYQLDDKRYDYWIKRGAQPTEAIIKLKEKKYVYTPYNAKTRKIALEEAENKANETPATEKEEVKEEKIEVEAKVVEKENIEKPE